jgi:hypothetical protein
VVAAALVTVLLRVVVYRIGARLSETLLAASREAVEATTFVVLASLRVAARA